MRKLEELYTVAEVAEILGVSEKSVRDFINAGEIRAVKVGQWRIDREAIEDFMDARSNHFLAKARTEVMNFLDGANPLGVGERRALVIRDYHANSANNHGHLVGALIQQLPEKSNIQWRYFYDQNLERARHIFSGDFQVIVRLLAQLDEKLEEGN